jgi:hypothetical protein
MLATINRRTAQVKSLAKMEVVPGARVTLAYDTITRKVLLTRSEQAGDPYLEINAVNPATGKVTSQAVRRDHYFFVPWASVCDSSGSLWIVDADNSPAAEFWQLDPGTGATLLRAQVPLSGWWCTSLAYHPFPDTFYTVVQASNDEYVLVLIDPVAGKEKQVIGNLPGYLSLAFAPEVAQEPSGPGHPSHVLYYGPGDGTVRVVDPATGNISQPIYATSQGQVVWVHWFAFDWPDNKMFVDYSAKPDRSLLLGTANPHSWDIKDSAVIDTTANFGLPNDTFDVQGLAYSQVTGMLYVNFSTSVSRYRGLAILEPGSGKLALDTQHFYYDFGLGGPGDVGHAMSNDPAGNLRYDFTQSGYEAGLTSYRTYWVAPLDDSGHYRFLDIYPVTANGSRYGDQTTLSPPGWSTFVEVSDLYALAVEPESGTSFVISGGKRFPKGLSRLNFFTYTWNPDNPYVAHYAHAESISERTLVETSDKGLSLVFVPWELPLRADP